MTFDPFRDFDSRGHLRNFFESKDVQEIKALEYSFFQINVERAINRLAAIDFIEYKRSTSMLKSLKGLGNTTVPNVDSQQLDEPNDPSTLTKKEQILRAAKKQKEESQNKPRKQKPPGKDMGGR